MAGESQKDPQTGQADPSVFTTEQLLRVVASERDYEDARHAVILERFRGMDEAAKVLHETVTRTPTDIQQAIGHLQELMDEKFHSVETQFEERDTRTDRESRDNKVAVDAAFAAQKESAAAQDLSNQKAIDKSETRTNDSIVTLGELFRTSIETLKERQNSFENQITEIRSLKAGDTESRNTQRLDTGQLLTILALLVSLAVAVFVMTRP